MEVNEGAVGTVKSNHTRGLFCFARTLAVSWVVAQDKEAAALTRLGRVEGGDDGAGSESVLSWFFSADIQSWVHVRRVMIISSGKFAC